jgi:antitoxin PrlF
MFATMTSKGQLTLPKKVRDELGLRSGDKILLTVVDGRLVGIPKNHDFNDLAGLLGEPPGGPATLAEIDAAVMDAVADHVFSAGKETRSREEAA